MTVTGCLQRGGANGDTYILASPRLGPVANVPDGACDAPIDARAVELEDARRSGINETLVGRWIEISGRLERETSSNPDNLRELYVRSFRLVPVVPPQRVEIVPAPVPLSEPAAPAPAPVATTSTPTAIEQPLPTTASPLAMFGLLGLLSVAGGLGVRFYRSRARG
jgi:hypothetical protein